MARNKKKSQFHRSRNGEVLRRVIRALCLFHRKPMLSDAMTKIVIGFLTDEMPVEALKRLRANHHDRAFVQAMRLATPFVV